MKETMFKILAILVMLCLNVICYGVWSAIGSLSLMWLVGGVCAAANIMIIENLFPSDKGADQ